MGWIFLSVFFIIFSPSISSAASMKLVDEVGREVFFPFPPKRIVSLAPNITEILLNLGMDEEMQGVSIHCIFAEKAKTKVRVGSYIVLDFERIVSLKPDLVIATGAGNTRDMVDRLERLGFPTYVLFPKNLEGILLSIDHVGQVVDRKKEALRIIQDMKRRR